MLSLFEKNRVQLIRKSAGKTKNLAKLILLISFEILKFSKAGCGVFTYGIVSLMMNNKLVHPPKSS